MSSTESTERKATRTIEKVVLSFMYLLFGAMFLGVALSGETAGFFVVVPIAALSIGLTTVSYTHLTLPTIYSV